MKRYRDALAEFKARFDASDTTPAVQPGNNERSDTASPKAKKKKFEDRGDRGITRKKNSPRAAGNAGRKPSKPNKRGGKQSPGKKALRQRDPSVKYLASPESAPKVQDAKNFFARQWPSGKFNIVCGKRTGWRTVAKLSVRGTPPLIGLFAPKPNHTS